MERERPNTKKSFRIDGTMSEEYQGLHSKKRVRWRFKPGSFWKLFTRGLMLFVFCRLILFPFVEGLSIYYAKTHELTALQARYKVLNKQLVNLKKTRNYMQTDAYIEERGHQIGMLKPNESQMVVMDAPEAGGNPESKSSAATKKKLFKD